MEHDEKPLPIDIRLLGALAEKVFLFSFLSFGVHVCVYMFMMYTCPCSMHAALLNNFFTVIGLFRRLCLIPFMSCCFSMAHSVVHLQKPCTIKKWNLKEHVPRRWMLTQLL